VPSFAEVVALCEMLVLFLILLKLVGAEVDVGIGNFYFPNQQKS
jgi:hypothetical protein